MEPRIVSPTPGSTLRGAIELFDWDLGGIPIEASWLYAGSSRGGSQFGARSMGAFTSGSMGGLPTDGSTVFIRIWYRTENAWRFIDGEYTAATSDGLPFIVDPVPDTTLSGPSQNFRWDHNGLPVESSWLYAGSVVGGSDHAAIFTGTDTSTLVGRLPTIDNGGDDLIVHVRLYFKTGGAWYHVDSQYRAGTVALPTKEALTRELQRLVGVTADGIVGPVTRAALNRNWLGRPPSFDPSFGARFTNDDAVVRWVQRRLNTRGRFGLAVDGIFETQTETAARDHLDKGGVVAAESFIELLEAG